jgi:hypothetical protein
MKLVFAKYRICFLTLMLFSNHANSQCGTFKDNSYKKGDFFFYWGWNRDAYSKSDIHFKGDNYNFVLSDVVAKDRQSPFDAKLYFTPNTITIPQYNFRIGYFFKDNYQISLGADHMKYVMKQFNTVKINGLISNSGTSYDGAYDNEDIVLDTAFLMFEHTDGLNYENIEIRRFDEIFGRNYFSLSVNEGLGVGVLVPRTNTTLLNNERYDQFHISGYGASAILALNLTIFKYFFIQSELKGGFIHMPDIRTTKYKSDRASQAFLFAQYNVVFGLRFNLLKENKIKKVN